LVPVSSVKEKPATGLMEFVSSVLLSEKEKGVVVVFAIVITMKKRVIIIILITDVHCVMNFILVVRLFVKNVLRG